MGAKTDPLKKADILQRPREQNDGRKEISAVISHIINSEEL
jgi:hypothetical protein